MAKKLPIVFLYIFFFAGTAFFSTLYPAEIRGQSTGDIAFIGFNSDGGDDFAIAAMEEIPTSTTIYFTDNEWNGSTFESGEGTINWNTGGAAISQGAVVIFSDVSSGAINVTTGSITGGSVNLNNSNEALFAYIGSEGDPSTFLAAISNNADQYNGTSGELTNTGLAQGAGAVLLSRDVDVAEYKGDRTGNTKNGYLGLINDISSNWRQLDGNGSFSSTGFVFTDAPTIRFSLKKQAVSEEAGTIKLTVILAQSNGTSVNADVVFVGGSGTASPSDINNYATQTVSFSSTAGDAATQTVTVTLSNDSDYEGTETAVFELQNVSTGAAIFPTTMSLIIEDNDAPDIVINEFLADPGREDANNDGISHPGDDRFVEIVNNEPGEIDLGNWTLSNGKGTIYTFPPGTVLPGNSALVVFGGGNPAGNFGGAVVHAAVSPGFNNNLDTNAIILRDANGDQVDQVSYGSSTTGMSMNRNPDGSGSIFTDHDVVAGAVGNHSPGAKVDGTPYGPALAIAITGSEGWRIVASPTQHTSFADLFGALWMRGSTGSNAPSQSATLYGWDETSGNFSTPSNMNEEMTPGKGYIVYVFEDNNYNAAGLQGGFPKIISANKDENISPVPVTLTSTDIDGDGILGNNEGWNLLGNPFGTGIAVSEVRNLLNSIHPDYQIQGDLQVWDPAMEKGNGGYKMLSPGETIAPFQAFWVQFDSTGLNEIVNFDRGALEAKEGSQFHKETEEINSLTFRMGDGTYHDTFSLSFRPDAVAGRDQYDTFKLYSLNSGSINLFGLLGGDKKLVKNVLPADLQGRVEIPLSFDTSRPGLFTLSWPDPVNLPKEWDLRLTDKKLGRDVDLRVVNSYKFETEPLKEIQTKDQKTVLNKTKTEAGTPRFTLAINSGTAQNGEESQIPESVKLNPNYPNPFNPNTTISFELTEQAEVNLNVYTIVGQKIATLVDEVREAGVHREVWNAVDMPSGIYIAQLEVNGKVYIRKMTLIK